MAKTQLGIDAVQHLRSGHGQLSNCWDHVDFWGRCWPVVSIAWKTFLGLKRLFLAWKPRRCCSGCLGVWLSFPLSTSFLTLFSFCLQEEQALLSHWQDDMSKACASPDDRGRLVPADPTLICCFRARDKNWAQKIETVTAFPAFLACSASLFYLLLIKVKLFVRKKKNKHPPAKHWDMRTWELAQSLFSKVSNDKWRTFDQGQFTSEYMGFF